jgi:hypothetical protein
MATVTASKAWVSGETVTPEGLNLTAAPTVVVADNEITTAKILDANVTAAKLASNAVETAKILNANVTTAKIADANVTTAKIADAAITPAKLNGAQTGSAPIYGVRAWCYFNGDLTGTNAPIAGANVTSITRSNPGTYLINFTNTMPSSNYSVVASAITSESSAAAVNQWANGRPSTTSQAQLFVVDGGFAFQDAQQISVMVIG